MECGGGVGGPFLKKNIHFYIQNDKFGCIFDAICNRQKTRTVPDALRHEFLRFNRETKLTQTV